MKILLALDPFGSSDRALTAALQQAKQQAAALVILAVAETFQNERAFEGLAGASEELFAQVRNKVEQVERAAIAQGVTPKVEIKDGPSPAQCILECAERENADLIVVGHREKKGLDRFLLGSVAAKIVAHAACSVLVVR